MNETPYISIRGLARLARIASKYRLDRLTTLGLRLPFWLTVLLLPLRLKPPPNDDVGTDFKLALIELGPAFIKLGQLLSTRRDLFPDSVSNQLATLQDQVPGIDSALALEAIKASLGDYFASHFQSINPTPLAAASIAQVHEGTLVDGTQVVIKFRRPGIKALILKDLTLLESLAALLHKALPDAGRLHLFQIVRDYRHVILAELDFAQEAANAIKLRTLWLPRGKLSVPKIHPTFTRDDLIVMDRVHGIVISAREQLIQANVNLERLANLGVEIFFTQVFIDNFFHADMHPGNILVDVTDPENPTYIALDCAIVGALTRDDRNYLGRNLIAFFNEDYRDIAQAHIDSGWVPDHIDAEAFEAVIKAVCAPLYGKTMSEIEFGKLLIDLFSAARAFEMEIQPQLVLLQKTLLNIEGIGRHLYGKLDLWATAAPFMQRWRTKKTSLPNLLAELKDLTPDLAQALPNLPRNLLLAPGRLDNLTASQRRQSRKLTDVQRALAQQAHRQTQQFGIWLMSLAAIGLLINANLGNDFTSALSITSVIIGGVGLQQILKGKG